MLGNYIIGLREGLEAALVVVVLLAYLTKTGRSRLKAKVWMGIAAAILVSVGFGALLTFGPRGLTFQAQEMIGGGLSLVAVCFVTWMIFWMGKASHNISRELETKVDAATSDEHGKGWGLVLLAALSVGREGLETALFVWANAYGARADQTLTPTIGAVLGILTAVVIGVILNRGAMRLNIGAFFTWTTYFLVFVAAGIFSYGLADLQEAGVFPAAWNALAFDFAPWANEADPTGIWIAIVKALFQLSPAMTWLAFGGWLIYILVMLPICTYRHGQLNGARTERRKAAQAAKAAMPDGAAAATSADPTDPDPADPASDSTASANETAEAAHAASNISPRRPRRRPEDEGQSK
ncbi:MAG: iron uptake transporter permease EfeU [Galactobacter sp.]